MELVSDSFKKAIKNDTREIYGYVDVKYQDNNYDRTVDKIPRTLDIFKQDGSGLLSKSKVMNNHATFENNYTLLNGSFMLWNENVIDENGYASYDTFNNITDNEITILNDSTDIESKGISIYFKDNLPFSFNVKIYDIDDNVIADENVDNNQSMNYQYIFNVGVNISKLSLKVNSVEYPDHRLRIANIDFNIGDLFDGEQLISFDIDEELDIMSESLPINSCNVELNNYPDSYGNNKFDPINPKGFVRYLNNSATIEPYVGVLTEENGVEYVKLGTFYLDSWSSNNDGKVSLSGKSILSKLAGLPMIVDHNFLFISNWINDFDRILKKTANVKTRFSSESYPWINTYLKHTDTLDYLQHLVPYLTFYNLDEEEGYGESKYRKFWVDRNNTLVLDEINNNVVDTITRNLLREDGEFTINKHLESVSVKQTGYGNFSNFVDTNIIQDSYTLVNSENYLWFSTDKYISRVNSVTGNVISGSANAELVANSAFMVLIKVTGNPGSIISLQCNAQVCDSNSNSHETLVYVGEESGDKLSIDFSDWMLVNTDAFIGLYDKLYKKLSVRVNTIGIPYLNIGDTISLETKYNNTANNYKNIMITKQKISYDGGLSSEIEGIGD